jgi:glutamine cyclotransferase
MGAYYSRYFILVTAILLLTWVVSCSGRPGNSRTGLPETTIQQPEAEPSVQLLSLVSPEENAEEVLNKDIKIVLSVDGNTVPDSVVIWYDGRPVTTLKNKPWESVVPSSLTSKTGRRALKVVGYKKNQRPQVITRFLVVYSDIVPARYGYRVIKEYPHDKGAFTQGLVYLDGVLYEGTGQETRSSLRKVRLETGQVLNQLNLEPQFFGEGIAILGEKIYQLTWQTKVGFVYDKNTFKLINRIYYQNEGWGLTTMDNKLVMSDGTNVLYFVDPESFSVISRIEVYDNRVRVTQLNELEYIKGEIWANIWQTDLIARIDPQSGKVTGYIDLKGILNDPQTDTSVNVLNGIAYDKAGDRIFVTGKNWPKLFEIKLTE